MAQVKEQENIGPRNKVVIHSQRDFKNGLPKLTKPLVTKRPALGDVGNKLHNRTGPDIVKPVVSKCQSIVPRVPKQTVQTEKTETVTSTFNDVLKISDTTVIEKTKITENKTTEVITLRKILNSAEEPKSYSSNFYDADCKDKNDPFLLPEYVNDIFDYLRKLEPKYCVSSKYLIGSMITPKFRMILVNWLVQLHSTLELLQETLYTAIMILDRYTEKKKTLNKDVFQLVGVTALFIAAKYEEVHFPSMDDLLYYCDGLYTRKQFITTELDILKVLRFNMTHPLSLHFLRRYCKVADVQCMNYLCGKFFLEIALVSFELAHIKPSIQAAAALCLALSILDSNVTDPSQVWTPILIHYSTYEYPDIKNVVIKLVKAFDRIQKSKEFTAVLVKYSDSKYSNFSSVPELKGPLMKKLLKVP